MSSSTLRSVAEDFWYEAGQAEQFPRVLEQTVLWALPVGILGVRELSVTAVEESLKRLEVPFLLGCHDRNLRACLLSYAGHGLIFLDADDDEDERRFSLAHEVSHFLLDYLLPRRRAVQRLGDQIVEVLDGLRPPTVNERVGALLSDAPVGFHTHLMERTSAGAIGKAGVLDIEGRADRLALELLAPEDEVRRRVSGLRHEQNFARGVGQTVSVLVEDFGLPPQVAEGYGLSLYRSWRGGPSFREWLGW